MSPNCFLLCFIVGVSCWTFVCTLPIDVNLDKNANLHQHGGRGGAPSLRNLQQNFGNEGELEFILPKKRRSVSTSSESEDDAPPLSSILLKDAPGILHPSPEVNFYRANYYYSPRSAAEREQDAAAEILQELRRAYAANAVPGSWKGSNLTNGPKSFPLALFASDWNKNSNNNAENGAGAGASMENESNTGVGGGVSASGRHVLRNLASSVPFHDPLGSSLSQWSFKPLYPLLNTDDSGRTAKRNANYMCHFKLCQLGASGKRKWDPSRWSYFNGATDYESSSGNGKSH